jgi:hypothetical protein
LDLVGHCGECGSKVELKRVSKEMRL